jgi:hypothetical protein
MHAYLTSAPLLLLLCCSAGIVSKYQGAPGIIGMHGGLPPADTFPFAAFDCTLQNSSSSSTDAAAAAAVVSSLGISDPRLVAAAQQYNMHAKVS